MFACMNATIIASCLILRLQLYHYHKPQEPTNQSNFTSEEFYETIADMEILSSALLKYPERDDPELNTHRLMGSMMKNIVRLTCKWVILCIVFI